ncbi:TetR/AcrR family transcriptional regulator [Catellatospora citrea]|uniref:TetR family transcriptional regulator n=1 Tax=Catellatospora citrea TaxID=53366 RepID=A0A8J3KHI3_9ACTN|nr:TetR family transcriptional regulator [Catellatospora citrea]RKE07047.1 TetR family transcriptional regulator [Catellatospora citrea]GIF95199.1 TetR family transcriptional regulator [Catellatospora citrea]
MKRSRTGRRPGNPDTREAILAAARQLFAEKGFDAATMRAIAAAAEVDPALVHHYFGTKEQLFVATMQFPMDPRELIDKVVAGGADEAGVRLARLFVTVWDSPVGIVGVSVIRSAMTNEWTMRLFREFVTTQILRRVQAELKLDPAEAPLRASLVASQIGGLVLMRYIMKLEPLASLPADQVVAAVAPNLQRYLTGDLGSAAGDGT